MHDIFFGNNYQNMFDKTYLYWKQFFIVNCNNNHNDNMQKSRRLFKKVDGLLGMRNLFAASIPCPWITGKYELSISSRERVI